jgi:hypothetical protein
MLQDFRDPTFLWLAGNDQRNITRLALQKVVPAIQSDTVLLFCSPVAFNATIKKQRSDGGLKEITAFIGSR